MIRFYTGLPVGWRALSSLGQQSLPVILPELIIMRTFCHRNQKGICGIHVIQVRIREIILLPRRHPPMINSRDGMECMEFIELSGTQKFGLLKLKDHHSWAIITLVTLGHQFLQNFAIWVSPPPPPPPSLMLPGLPTTTSKTAVFCVRHGPIPSPSIRFYR